MKATELKKALDVNIRKASQNTVNKIKTDIKKNQAKSKSKMVDKKETVRYVKDSPFEGLKQIVEMKKNKAVVNELDSLIFEQEAQKTRRSTNTAEAKPQERKPSPLEVMLAADPDRIKDMSMEDIIKLSMVSSSGGGDPLSMIMAMNMSNKDNNGKGNDLQTKLLGMVIEKMFKGNNGDANKSGGDMEMVKLMMQQNMQTQNMMMNMIMQKQEAPTEDKNSMFMKELFGMVKGQTDFENTFLRDKIQNLEMRQNSNDPLGEAKRMMDYIKTFKGFFGAGGNSTPESMNHEIKLKELNFEQQRQVNEDSRRTSNMEQIGSMINNTIETFGKILGEPIAEAAKSKIEQYTEHAQNPEQPVPQRVRISPEQLQKEVDLGDLENLENDLAEFEQPKKSKSKFTVYETG